MIKFIAILCAKILLFLGKFFGRGTSLPGYIALKIDKNICDKLDTFKAIKIAVTGANGKSTTTNILYKLLTKNNYKVSANLEGSNMRPGVLTSILDKTNLFGKVKVDIILMEVDEFSSIKVYKSFKPDYLIVTNILRDHIERQSDILNVINKINEKLDKNTVLILNADDPLMYNIMKNKNNKRFYYGIEDINCKRLYNSSALAAKFCFNCGEKLLYENYFYEHLGHYACPKCEFKRPHNIDIKATNIDLQNHLMVINDSYEININYDVLYMYYNYLAVIAANYVFKLPISNLKDVMKNFSIGNARLEEFYINNRKGVMNFLKNSTSLTATMDLIYTDREEKTLVFFMDNTYDGHYFITQWYWDSCLKQISEDDSIKNIICTWKRAYEMAVRIKSAGVDVKKIIVEPDIYKALDILKTKTIGKIYLGYDTDSYNIKNIRNILSKYPGNKHLKEK